ncbi:MAG: ribonuclease domain-containing protein [Planctomycetaceae bacterium]
MAAFTGYGKHEYELIGNDRLPDDLRVAIIEFKNSLKVGIDLKSGGRLETFKNKEGLLPPLAAGNQYYEYYVGQAHTGDKRPAGRRRLVALVNPSNVIQKIYFTQTHYSGSIWKQLQYP